MSKTFNSFDLIVICSLIWNAIKTFVKVFVIMAILDAIVWYLVEAVINA